MRQNTKECLRIDDTGGEKMGDAKLRILFDEQIVSEVLAVPLKPQATRDKTIWTTTKQGIYSAKGAYHQIRDREKPFTSDILFSANPYCMEPNLADANFPKSSHLPIEHMPKYHSHNGEPIQMENLT